MRGRNRIFRILLLIFVFACASGCSSTTRNKAMGRYVEEAVVLPREVSEDYEEILSMAINPKGQVELFTRKQDFKRYTLEADGTWTENTPKWDINGLKLSDATIIRYGNNGGLYMAAGLYKEGTIQFKLYELYEDGTKKEIPMEGWDRKEKGRSYPYITAFAVMDNGDILANMLYSDIGVRYAASGKIISEFESAACTTVNSTGPDIITINKAHNKIVFMDKETGLHKNEMVISTSDQDGLIPTVAICNDGSNNIYIANRNGIYYFDKEGSVTQAFVEGTSTLNLSYLSINSIIKAADNSFYVLLKDQSGHESQLMHYVYRPDISTKPEKELTVYSLEDSEIIKVGAALYQQKHPEVRINYRVAKMEESNLPMEDYIKILNDEILKGNGADIIICDSLPERDYVKKGIFEDISDIINPLVNKNQIFGSIVDCYRQNGKIYTLPVKFDVSIYAGDEAAVGAACVSLDQLAAYGEKNLDIPLLGKSLSYQQLFSWFYRVYSKELLDSEGLPIPDKLIPFLKRLKEINRFNGKMNKNYYYPINCFTDKAQNKCRLIAVDVNDMRTWILAREVAARRNNQVRSAGNVFYPDTVIGINKKSKRKDIAKEFISMLLSEEVQKRSEGIGIPLNKAALSSWKTVYAGWKATTYVADADDRFLLETAYWATDGQITALCDMISHLTTPERYDTTAYSIIMKELASFFQGDRSAEEVTAAIMKKISANRKE